MAQITGAFANVNQIAGSHGPWRYGSNLYAIAFSSDQGDFFANATLAIFKSADDGATWTTVGTDQQLTNATVSSLEFSETFGTCLDVNFPTSPYAYAAFVNVAGELQISRANFDLEEWDTFGTGPTPETHTGARVGILLEQATDGNFVIAYSQNVNGPLTHFIARTVTCNSSLAGWSAITDVAGQDEDFDYVVFALARGTEGRVHGFTGKDEDPGSSFDVLHFYALGGASGLTAVTTSTIGGIEAASGAPEAIGMPDGTIHVIVKNQTSGFGSFFQLSVASSVSSASMSWTNRDIDISPSTDPAIGFLCAVGTTAHLIYIGPSAWYDTSFNGSSWIASTELLATTDFTAYLCGFYSNGKVRIAYSPDNVDLFYRDFVFSTDQIVTNDKGILSAEAFGRTHGVTGGGDPPGCGAGPPITPAPGTPAPTPSAPATCGTIGYAF